MNDFGEKSSLNLSVAHVLLWIVTLAMLSVGARNFEPGFSPDSPIYSTISRNISEHGDWMRLDASIPDYQPYFADHPHLGFWLVATVFHVLPPADWSARIVGHLLYVAFLLLMFFNVRRLSGQKAATWTVLLLWSWYIFSNTFSSFMMDPGVLFFGTASVFCFEASLARGSRWLSMGAGVLFSLALLYKGLAATGFLPCLAMLLVTTVWQRKELKTPIALSVAAIAGTVIATGAYVIAVSHSSVPDFLTLYFSRQFAHRIGPTWAVARLFSGDFWLTLLKYTFYLSPLVLISWWKNPPGISKWMPTTLLLTYLVVLPSAGLFAPHHYIMLMPWIAWLLADGVFSRIPWSTGRLVQVTMAFSVTAVIILQYLPVKVHGAGPLPVHQGIVNLREAGKIDSLILDHPPLSASFLIAGSYAWYGKTPVQYPPLSGIAGPSPRSCYFLHQHYADKQARLKRAGWCKVSTYPEGSLWVDCHSRY